MRTLNECFSEMESAIRRVEDCIAEARAVMAEMERLSPDAGIAPEPLDINLEDMVELDEAFGNGEKAPGIVAEPIAVSVQESDDAPEPESEPGQPDEEEIVQPAELKEQEEQVDAPETIPSEDMDFEQPAGTVPEEIEVEPQVGTPSEPSEINEAEQPAGPLDVPELEPSEDLPVDAETETVGKQELMEDLPFSFIQEPEPVRDQLYNDEEDRPLILDGAVGGRKSSVMDVVGKKNSWRTDMPGTPVKNILSAISLNDRILFINTLFRRDALLFQSTVSRVNNMADFEEAESYLTSMFPEWKLDSEAVYRFMMAIRRRFN